MKGKLFFSVIALMLAMAVVGNVYGAALQVGVGQTYTMIQPAIDAASPGDIVNVEGGNYTEQITITKSLSLIGAGETTTTILAPAVRTGSVVHNGTTHDYLLAAYATGGTIDVRVQGFTLDVNSKNKTPGTAQIDGVFFRDVNGANAGLFSSTIHNFAAAPAYEGFGVVVYGGSLLTLNDNDVSDYTRDGISINRNGGSGSNPNVTISGNAVTGTVSAALNGISISTVTAGAVTGNTVTGNSGNIPMTWASGGIVIWTSTGVPITGNHVDGNFYGIDLYNGSHDITISGNELTGNIKRGISLGGNSLGTSVGTDNSTVSGNTIIGPVGGTDDVAIGVANGSTGNMIGGPNPADGNTITMATAGTGNLYAIHMDGSMGAGSNTIKNNTIIGGKRAVQFDGPPGVTGLTTVANNAISSQEFGGITAYNTGDLAITNNTLTNAVRPIEFFGPRDVTISGNTINGSTFDAINAGSYTGTVIVSDKNKFISLPAGPLALNNQGAATINAANNYWGSAASPDALVSGTVDFDPWYIDGEMLNLSDAVADADDIAVATADPPPFVNVAASVTVDIVGAVGTGTIVTSAYSADPVTSTTFSTALPGKAALKYVDVQVTGLTGGTAVITVDYSDAEVSAKGLDENTLILYVWYGGAWNAPVSSPGRDVINNKVWGTFNVTDLTGAPAAPGGSPPLSAAIPTLNEWGLIIFGSLILVIAVRSIRRKQRFVNIA